MIFCLEEINPRLQVFYLFSELSNKTEILEVCHLFLFQKDMSVCLVKKTQKARKTKINTSLNIDN